MSRDIEKILVKMEGQMSLRFDDDVTITFPLSFASQVFGAPMFEDRTSLAYAIRDNAMRGAMIALKKIRSFKIDDEPEAA